MEDIKDIEFTIDADTSTTPGNGIDIGSLYKVTRNGIGLRIVGLSLGTLTDQPVYHYRYRAFNPSATNPPGAGMGKSGTTFLGDYVTQVRIFSVVQPEANYNITIAGTSVNYTALPGDTDQDVAEALEVLLDAQGFTVNSFFSAGYWMVSITTPGTTPPVSTVTLTPAGSYRTISGWYVDIPGTGGMHSIAQTVGNTYDYPAYPALTDPLDFNDFTDMYPGTGTPVFRATVVNTFCYNPAYPVRLSTGLTLPPFDDGNYDVDNIPTTPGVLEGYDVYQNRSNDTLVHGTPFFAGNPEVVRYLYK